VVCTKKIMNRLITLLLLCAVLWISATDAAEPKPTNTGDTAATQKKAYPDPCADMKREGKKSPDVKAPAKKAAEPDKSR
jgi:hypothetical protein